MYDEITRWRKSRHSNPNGACVELANVRKSSYSSGDGNCLEAGEVKGDWRKSTHSGYHNSCVEAASVVGIRDTKQAHLGDQRTVLVFSPVDFTEFTNRIKSGWTP